MEVIYSLLNVVTFHLSFWFKSFYDFPASQPTQVFQESQLTTQYLIYRSLTTVLVTIFTKLLLQAEKVDLSGMKAENQDKSKIYLNVFVPFKPFRIKQSSDASCWCHIFSEGNKLFIYHSITMIIICSPHSVAY